MSKDLTPKEFLALEQIMIEKDNLSIIEMMKNLSFISSDGEVRFMYSKENIERCEQFPLLGKLYNHFDSLYEHLVPLKGGIELLKHYEEELELYVETGSCEVGSLVIQWFEGNLDDNFYYSEVNDRVFFDKLIAEAEEIDRTFSSSKESLDVQILSASNSSKYICIVANEDKTWEASISDGNDGVSIKLTEEKTYPVKVFYSRTDLNGSESVEREICNNRDELIQLLNWIGKCGFIPLEVWNYDIDKSNDEQLSQIFQDGLSRRFAVIQNEVFDFDKDVKNISKSSIKDKSER